MSGLPDDVAGVTVAVIGVDGAAAVLQAAGAFVVTDPSTARAVVASSVDELLTATAGKEGLARVLVDGSATFQEVTALIGSGGGAIVDGGPCDLVRFTLVAMSGGFSGGTAHSLLGVLDATAKDPAARPAMSDPYAFVVRPRRVGPDVTAASWPNAGHARRPRQPPPRHLRTPDDEAAPPGSRRAACPPDVVRSIAP